MSNDDGATSRGRFRGKRITFASTARIEEFAQIASDFMEQIFELWPGDYVISDESDIRDFTELGSSDTSAIWKRISTTYGIERSHVSFERLVDIFAAIARRRNIQ